MAQLRILVAGATGYIGRDVVRELVGRGHEVTALLRTSIDTAHNPIIDTALEGARRALWPTEGLGALAMHNNVDVVISCIASRTGVARDAWRVDHDANLALLTMAQGAGAKRFVLLSAICVQKPRLAFQLAKLEFEQALASSGIDYAIVRPTAYFKSLSGQIERVRGGKPYLMFGNGELTACKPISARDLAAFIAQHTEAPAAANAVLPIGGPGPAITPREQGELLFELTGTPPTFRRVPPGMFTLVASLLTPLGWLLPSLRAKAELARIGHYYATESMLVWDAENARYEADQTPSFGSDTLREFFAHALETGLAGQELGDQRVFSRSQD